MPPAVAARMAQLEERDAADRADGTTKLERLRQITPETGRFLAILAASVPPGAIVEVGTSAGYSTLWLALAAWATGRRVTTYELLAAKVELATETFAVTGANEVVDLVAGDALAHLADLHDIAFCFLDAEKDIYAAAYNLVVPRLVPGGLLVADNVISHQAELQPFVHAAHEDPRVDAVVVPIGKGELLCRRR